jgi:hypothetical protein
VTTLGMLARRSAKMKETLHARGWLQLTPGRCRGIREGDAAARSSHDLVRHTAQAAAAS